MQLPSSPGPHCWLSPLATVGRSAIEGDGLFATEGIPRGTVVSRFGGRLVSDHELEQVFAQAAGYVDTLSIGEDLNLLLPPGAPNRAGNHSCDPNLWWSDPFTLTARRDVRAGEELTLDYATITDDPHHDLECRCGSVRCRGRVTGVDWRLGELRSAYGDHWVPVLRDRIAAA